MTFRTFITLTLLTVGTSASGQYLNLHYVDGIFKDGATEYHSVHKFGRVQNIQNDEAPIDLISWGVVYAGFIAAADTIIVVSDAAADSIGSTGALTVNVVGLNAAGYEIQQTCIMTGRTNDTLAVNMFRAYRAWVVTAGSGETNAGNITVKTDAGVILAQIPAGLGQTLQTVYTIPNDYEKALLAGFDTTAEKKNASEVLFYLQIRPSGGAWRTIETWGAETSTELHFDSEHHVPVFLEPLTDIRMRIQSVSADDTDVSGTFELWLIR